MTARAASKYRKSPASRPRGTRRGKSKPEKPAEGYNYGREFVLTVLGCLWIIIGTALIGLCAGIYYGSTLAADVLEEIGEHDYSGPRQRIARYEDFFSSLDTKIYKVDQAKPNVDQGKVSISWVVTLRGSQERRRFHWVHDLQAFTVMPRTNPALCLDVELGLISADDAAAYTDFETEHTRYDPDDSIVQSIVKSNYSLAQVQDLESGWQLPSEEPVGAPLVSPEEGAGRQRAKAKEEEEEEEQAGGGDEEQPAEPNDATSVIGSNGNSSESTNE